MKLRNLCSAALLTFLPIGAYAQGIIEPGFELNGSLPNPAPFSNYTTLQDGTRAHFDGNTVSQHSLDGTFLQNLHIFPSINFTGCLAADPSGDSLLVGESTNGNIYRVEMDGSGATLLANLPFNYAAVYAEPGVAYVSAAVNGFGGGNEILRVDTLSGNTTTVVQLDGPSGPVAMNAQGDLIYGTSTDFFPAPAGSSALYKFTSAQLNSGVILTDGDAEVLNSSLDPISSIAVDPVMGDIVISTNIFDSTFAVVKDEILIVRPSGDVKDVVSMTSGGYRSSVELIQGAGPGHFRAYQPEGVELTWLQGDQIHTLAPKRPTSAVVSNGGNSYSFVVSGAEPGGAMLLAFGNSAQHQGVESSYQLNFDFLYHSGLAPGQTRRVGQFLIPCDASGTASFPFWDAGNLQGTVVFQGVITDQSGAFIGSSESAFH